MLTRGVLDHRVSRPRHRRLAETSGIGKPLPESGDALILIEDPPARVTVELDEQIAHRVASEIDGGQTHPKMITPRGVTTAGRSSDSQRAPVTSWRRRPGDCGCGR